jgi:Ca2+-binding EF-hand superfamily protein
MRKILMALVVIICAVSRFLPRKISQQKLDKNKDGKVSKKEYSSAVSKTFDKLDKNRDGSITRDELGHMDKKTRKYSSKKTTRTVTGLL